MEEDFSALETALEVANDVFGVKYSKDYKKLVDAKAYAGKHYAIDDRVEIICDGAFKDCDNLEEIGVSRNCHAKESKKYWRRGFLRLQRFV